MGSGFSLPSQLLSARRGLYSVFWDQECRLPTQPGCENKRPIKSFVQTHLLGCKLETLVRHRVTQSAICRELIRNAACLPLHVNSDLLNPGLHVSKIPRSFLCMSQFETCCFPAWIG